MLKIDAESMTATIEGGASYGQVCTELDDSGFALQNLASLPHISVVGAVATATHGSGANNANMATAVSGVEFVDARGDLATLSRAKDGNAFDGVPVHLGGLGLITKITLDLVPSFNIRQHSVQPLRHLAGLLERFASLAMVADGVGITGGGEEAARSAVEAIRAYVAERFHEAYAAATDEINVFGLDSKIVDCTWKG